jgi:hypothetical protein
MRIGYAQTVITPSLDRPVYLAGFGNNRRAVSVHDDLYARALALQEGPVTLVLVALDLLGFFRPDACAVASRVAIPGVSILVASTHTHHGPDTMGLWGPDLKTCGVDPVYMQGLAEKTELAIRQAVKELQPASGMKSGLVRVPGVAKNARNPGIVDEELTALQFLGTDGRVLVSLFDFPCHPEVLWEHNTHITSDYPGVLRSQVEARTDAPCIFFSGALGGMMTPDVKDHSFEECEAMGTALARAGLDLLAGSAVVPADSLSLQKRLISVKLTNILYKLAFRRRLLPDVRDRAGQVQSEVNLVKVGKAWFATVPGELLPRLGLALKASLREAGGETVGVIGLANDELGYILPKEDFKYPLNPFRPGKHYEETNSIGKGIGPAVMRGVQDLF